jgi:lambda repressor-like predicted transcriptional regulator
VALSYEFLLVRAEQAAHEAACAKLDNVRERSLRSEAAYRTMATQALEAARSREFAQQQRLVANQWGNAPQ